MLVIMGGNLLGFPKGMLVNSSLPEQNGRHFADDIFICIFMNEGPIDNNPALV